MHVLHALYSTQSTLLIGYWLYTHAYHACTSTYIHRGSSRPIEQEGLGQQQYSLHGLIILVFRIGGVGMDGQAPGNS